MTNNGGCGPTRECIDDPGSFHCVCREGFSGDNETCVDIDECAAGHNNCDANADCTNVEGGYQCRCREGLVGNGLQCGTFQGMVALGWSHACEIRRDGSLWCWGDNKLGQLGIGTAPRAKRPARVGSAADWRFVTVGPQHTCALKKDGSLWCWGDGNDGGLGDRGDSAVSVPTPTQVFPGTRWIAIATGGVSGNATTCGIKEDGSLWCWGTVLDCSTGTSKPVTSKAPLKIGADTDWTDVSLSLDFKCALKSHGSVWCWGNNGNGQLGKTLSWQADPYCTLTRVVDDGRWLKMSVGSVHSCGIRMDHSTWCWGRYDTGNGEIAGPAPTLALEGADWSSVASGFPHSCAVKQNGELWCWGWNQHGELGFGRWNEPGKGRVGSETDWIAVSANDESTCALKATGALWCWGHNQFGQLGVGDYVDRFEPALVHE